MAQIERFTIDVSDGALADLRRRVAETRWPVSPPDPHWAEGVDVAYLRDLASYWCDGFDWRAQEVRLNELSQVVVNLDGVRIHAVHVRGTGDRTLPLVLTNGWPSTFTEFVKVIGPLTDPGSYGGDPADGFDVVVPSLPGYGFSDPLPAGQAGVVTHLWAELMSALGYVRFGAHGSDIGGYVTNRLALEYPDRLIGLHTTYPVEPWIDSSEELSAHEQEFWLDRPRGKERGGGYTHIQRTRPVTLAYGLTDSPVGLAAWILDKWREWSDCGGELSTRFSRDELLTNVSLYWLTGTIGSSFRFYRDWGLGVPPELVDEYPHALPGVEPKPLPVGQRIAVPAGVACFGHGYPPDFVLRGYADLRRWSPMPTGGHFPALEEPGLLVENIRAFYRPLR